MVPWNWFKSSSESANDSPSRTEILRWEFWKYLNLITLNIIIIQWLHHYTIFKPGRIKLALMPTLSWISKKYGSPVMKKFQLLASVPSELVENQLNRLTSRLRSEDIEQDNWELIITDTDWQAWTVRPQTGVSILTTVMYIQFLQWV